MIDLKNIKRIYFIGIGGIGMSALARYFKAQGKKVSGYDRTQTELTEQLAAEGIPVHYEESLDQAPKDADMVVYTPAVPADHKELVFYRNGNYQLLKRSEVLGLITNSSFNICVAGTHGKTTISTMIAHILRHSGYGCNAFLGGVATNYGTNFWSSPNNVCVVEADEYDRSFLRLSPDIAIITAMDADHLDIYGTEKAMEDAFIEFSGKVKADGLLLSKFGLKRGSELRAADHKTYSLQNESADIHGAHVRINHGSYLYDVMLEDFMFDDVRLNMGGMHNVENSIAAIAVARQLNIDWEKIKLAVEEFKGVKRRFEYIVRNDNIVFIDDYAHHPEELRALINGAKALYKNKRCTVVFQPHLYSRTKDLAAEFAKVLDMAHEVILLPIYPAREQPIPGVSSSMILDRMYSDDKHIMNKEELLNWVKTHEVELFITAGAGDIDTLVQPLKEILSQTT